MTVTTIPDTDSTLTTTDDSLVQTDPAAALAADIGAESGDLTYTATGTDLLALDDITLVHDRSTIDVRVTIPTALAVILKSRTTGQLDIAESVALIVQLYAAAPLERRAVVLTESQHARICSTLGFTPRTNDELVGAIESLTAISFGGVRVQFTAEDVELMNARNASEMAPKEFAKHVVMLGFEAWKNGTIG